MFMNSNNLHKYINELIGVFFLVLTIGCTVIAGSAGVLAPLAIASILMVFIYAGGHLSGAHYNPVVSLAMWLRGRMAQADLVPYMLFQVAGALLAAAVVNFLKRDVIVIPAAIIPAHVFVAEFLFTFALVYVVLNVATAKNTDRNSYFGLAIGFTVLAGAFAVGSISSAAFNPAVNAALGVMGLMAWENLWVYLLAQVLGAVVAAYTFLFLNPLDR